jgi:hypothetical protein
MTALQISSKATSFEQGIVDLFETLRLWIVFDV